MYVTIKLRCVQEVKEIGGMKKSTVMPGQVFKKTALLIKFRDGGELSIPDDNVIGYGVQHNMDTNNEKQS